VPAKSARVPGENRRETDKLAETRIHRIPASAKLAMRSPTFAPAQRS
jgi:hypothetical protein